MLYRILRYRGYPIEELAEKSTFMEVGVFHKELSHVELVALGLVSPNIWTASHI